MKKPIHGGRVDQAMRELDLPREQIIDYSASVNPLGAPPQVRRALRDAVERINDYPEPGADSLRADLADFHGLPQENLLPGSGSTALIYLLPRVLRPRRVLLVQPAFGEYAPAFQQVGCQVDTFALQREDGFQLSVDKLMAAVEPDTEMVMLANPGNPTGVGIDPQQLVRLSYLLGGRRLVVDEAFVDFCPKRSLLSEVTQLPNLLVLRSLTKFYAIAGLRAGYLAGPVCDIALLAAAQEPWSLSNMSIAAARACLAADDYRLQTLKLIPRFRTELTQGLEKLKIKVYPSEANYLCCELPDLMPRADRIKQLLHMNGLLIRNCEDFSPLDNRFFRVAVLGTEANRCLLEKLSLVLG